MRPSLFKLLYLSGVGFLLHRLQTTHIRLPVLVFHRVSPDWDPYTEPMHPEGLSRVFSFLQTHYSFVHLTGVFEDDFKLPPNALAVTFDDATTDFAAYAFPILQKFQVPATLFIPTEAAGYGENIWNYRFLSLFKSRSAGSLSLVHGKKKFKFNWADKAPNGEVMKLHRYLLGIPSAEREAFIHETAVQLGVTASDQEFARTMNWSELRKLKAMDSGGLLSFGSHTHTHSPLPNLEKAEQLEHELVQSRNLIQKELGSRPEFLAYPNGLTDGRISAMARKYYKAAFSTAGYSLTVRSIRKSSMSLPRYLVYYKDPMELYLRINGLEKLWHLRTRFTNFLG